MDCGVITDPGSQWPIQYPELLNVTTDHFGLPIDNEISDNVYDSPVFLRTATGINATTPEENAANLKAWLSTADNNTKQVLMPTRSLTLKSNDEELFVLPTCVAVAGSGSTSATELWAAKTLAKSMSLPLVYHLPSGPMMTTEPSQIAVGYSAAVALGVSPSALSSLSDDAFSISTVGDGSSLAIASSAHSARGSINGIYEFMRKVGFRFLAANVTSIPKKPWSLPVGFTNTTFAPPLRYRDISTSPVMDHSAIDRNSSHTFAASLGLNGQYAKGPVGGSSLWSDWSMDGSPMGWPRAGFVATAFDLLSPHLLTPPDQPPGTPDLSVWRAHPEWFVCKSLHCKLPHGQCPPHYPCAVEEINRTYYSQPCWSNSSMQQYMTSSILRILRQNPAATSISVSNMDGTWVVCPEDNAANEAENSTGGANFRAVQAIADSVNKEFPRVKIATLAYDASLAAPARLRLKDNVIVQLCLQNLAHFVPLSHPLNKPTLDLVQAWTRAAKTLFVWDYTVSFYDNMLPWASYRSQALHMQELTQLGIQGYFGQGWSHAGVDMIDLKTYVASRVAYDPRMDVDKLIVEFTDDFYSSNAAPHVRASMDLMSVAFASSAEGFDVTLDTVAGLNSTLLAAVSALQTAKQVASPGEQYQLRLGQAMMNLQFVVLRRWDQLREYAARTKQTWPLAPTLAVEFQRFSDACSYAFRNSREAPHFQEDLGPDAQHPSLHHKKDCDLQCFAKQLGLEIEHEQRGDDGTTPRLKLVVNATKR